MHLHGCTFFDRFMSVRVRSSSVGAHPRPKPVLVSRAESTVPVAAEVRCGCQFYKSDSLLPERINPVGQSRPQSSADYYGETSSRPISPLFPTSNTSYGAEAHFARPTSKLSVHGSSRLEIIRPEPIIISAPIQMDTSSSTFRPIQDKPPKPSSPSFIEDNHLSSSPPIDAMIPSSSKEPSPFRPSLIGKDRYSDRNINVSTQILRDRSRSSSLHRADNVGKIVKTVSFEFGGPDGPDQYRSPYAEHDLNHRNMTASMANNNGGSVSAIGSKNSAHSFVKFERKDRNSQDRYFNNSGAITTNYNDRYFISNQNNPI